VFPLLVPGLLTTCYKVVELNRLVTSCSNNLLSSCNSIICQQVVSDNLVATWQNNCIVTTCWQACYKVVANTSCWQVVRFLRVYTRTNLTACQQDVLALLVPSSWQVRNKLLSACNKVDEANRLATSLLDLVQVRLPRGDNNNLVTTCYNLFADL
jgi:hypothetical protein